MGNGVAVGFRGRLAKELKTNMAGTISVVDDGPRVSEAERRSTMANAFSEEDYKGSLPATRVFEARGGGLERKCVRLMRACAPTEGGPVVL